MPFPLTKTCDPADLASPLVWEASQVAQQDLSGQHPLRAWEYSMALHAIREWLGVQPDPLLMPYPPVLLLDIGGAGSPLIETIEGAFPQVFFPALIDPTVNHAIETSPLGDACAQVITCISVLEHVEYWKAFLRAVTRHLAPGGLLVLTVDYWDCEGRDTAHFHWMRQRIYNRASLGDVLTFLRDEQGCRRFGGCDWTYHGDQLYLEQPGDSYTFASVVVRKEGA